MVTDRDIFANMFPVTQHDNDFIGYPQGGGKRGSPGDMMIPGKLIQ